LLLLLLLTDSRAAAALLPLPRVYCCCRGRVIAGDVALNVQACGYAVNGLIAACCCACCCCLQSFLLLLLLWRLQARLLLLLGVVSKEALDVHAGCNTFDVLCRLRLRRLRAVAVAAGVAAAVCCWGCPVRAAAAAVAVAAVERTPARLCVAALLCPLRLQAAARQRRAAAAQESGVWCTVRGARLEPHYGDERGMRPGGQAADNCSRC
jgi:hypothetical protein